MEIEEIIEKKKQQPRYNYCVQMWWKNQRPKIWQNQSFINSQWIFLKILFANGKVQHLRKTLN